MDEAMDRYRKALTVLIVDDVDEMRKILKTILHEFGFGRILEAENGAEALEIMKDEPINLAVVDWNMPEMSGLELLQEVRRHPALKPLPFLMVTSEADRDKVVSAIAAGVSDYIVKPFSRGVLEAKIDAILK